MRATAISKETGFDEEGQPVINNYYSQCNFDQKEIFSWTLINDEDDNPEYIILITKNGVSMEVVYEESTISDLAKEFRTRGVL